MPMCSLAGAQVGVNGSPGDGMHEPQGPRRIEDLDGAEGVGYLASLMLLQAGQSGGLAQGGPLAQQGDGASQLACP